MSKTRWNRWVFKIFLNLLVSVASLILSGKQFQAAGPAWLKQRLPNLSPMHSTAGNWTELNSTELFSSVQFSAVHWTGDNSETKLAVVAGSSLSGAHPRESANQCDVCRWTKTGDELRRPSPVVAGSMHAGKLNWTQLNWTERSSSVQFSSVFRCALGFSSSATFDVVSGVGGPQAGSTTGFSDCRRFVEKSEWVSHSEWAKYGARPVWTWCINVHNLHLILCSR